MMKFLNKRPREDEPSDAATASSSTASDTSPPGPAEKAAKPAPIASDAALGLIESLTDESWRSALANEFAKPYFDRLATQVASQRASKTVFPPKQDVFTALNYTPLPDVRVVILGQDPYHGPGQAHGLAFSVGRGVQVPPSLKNIYTELESDLGAGKFKRPSHGHLISWSKRGVLLLNASLTVRSGEANSHAELGWQTFTDAIVKTLNQRKEPIVFILWGKFAEKKGASISRSKHHVIVSAHPSPLSVTKFRGCKCFSKANKYLTDKGLEEINWNVDE